MSLKKSTLAEMTRNEEIDIAGTKILETTLSTGTLGPGMKTTRTSTPTSANHMNAAGRVTMNIAGVTTATMAFIGSARTMMTIMPITVSSTTAITMKLTKSLARRCAKKMIQIAMSAETITMETHFVKATIQHKNWIGGAKNTLGTQRHVNSLTRRRTKNTSAEGSMSVASIAGMMMTIGAKRTKTVTPKTKKAAPPSQSIKLPPATGTTIFTRRLGSWMSCSQ